MFRLCCAISSYRDYQQVHRHLLIRDSTLFLVDDASVRLIMELAVGGMTSMTMSWAGVELTDVSNH